MNISRLLTNIALTCLSCHGAIRAPNQRSILQKVVLIEKKYTVFILVGVVAGLFLWWRLSPAESRLEQSALLENSKPDTVQIVASNIESSPVGNDAAPVALADDPLGNPADAQEVKNWFAEHGNFHFLGPEYLADYRAYNLDTLTRLSDAGDLKAMYVLSERADSFEGVRAIHWKAALYGSTQALIEMGSLNENEEGDLNKLSADRRKEKIVEAFAYYEVAQMRGDWWGNMSSGKSLMDRYQIDLTDEDKQKISKRATVVYEDLQAKRIEKSLGEFDNSVPDSVIKFYENILRSQTPTKN